MQVKTPKQAERRRRVILAVLELGSQRGYDGVQMRDVSARADVALGTIYRYFQSKDHLLSSAMAEWLSDLEARVVRLPLAGDTAADQITEVFTTVVRGIQCQPRLLRALITAVYSSDRGVAEGNDEIQESLRKMVVKPLTEFEPQLAEDILSNIRHVLHSTLMLWVHSRIELEDISGEIERMVRLVVTPYESALAGGSSRPAAIGPNVPFMPAKREQVLDRALLTFYSEEHQKSEGRPAGRWPPEALPEMTGEG